MSHVAAIALIALTILGEARSQPPDGQACLAHTVVNRMALSGWSAEEVLFQPWQYLVWERDIVAPDYGLRLRWLVCLNAGAFPDNPRCVEPLMAIGTLADWEAVYVIAEDAYLGGAPPEGCERVLNYDNLDKFWGGADPPWAANMELAICIADHCFYRPLLEETNANIRVRMHELRDPL